jgi:hypothetical protein
MLDAFADAVADRVSPRWWRVRERELLLYRRLGVGWFARRFVNGGSHGGRNVPFLRRQRGTRSERLRSFERFARGIETKHLAGLVAGTPVPVTAWMLGHGWLGTLLALVNLAGHGYPIMSMRYVRARADQLLRLAALSPRPRAGSARPGRRAVEA